MVLRYQTNIVLFLFLVVVITAWAQLPGASTASTPPAQATQVPLSGRNPAGGSVQATESPVPGVTTTINTISPQVQVSGPYSGSAVSTNQMPFAGRLSLHDAIQRGLAYNLGGLDSLRTVEQSNGQVRISRSALLPNLTASLTENVEQEDIAALGFRFNFSIPGFVFPTVVGPFNYFDLQASLTQTVLNITERDNYRSARATLQANQLAARDARDLIVLAIGGAYLQVLTAKARLASAQAQLATADAILAQSQHQFSAGTLAQLPLDQNQVQDATQQQQLTTLNDDLAKQKINLARMVGLPPDDRYDITDDVPFSPPPPLSEDAAVAEALNQRSDLKAAEAALQAARDELSAADAERLPTASVSADYGAMGINPANSHGVFSVVGSVSMPLWQGGKIGGDQQVANAAVLEREAELEDTRGQVEAEVREAYLDLQAAATQVEVSERNLQTAHETLSMARLRFDAGVINTVELVQAQQSVATAELDYINSVFAHNVAKLSLARALGIAADQWQQYLHIS